MAQNEWLLYEYDLPRIAESALGTHQLNCAGTPCRWLRMTERERLIGRTKHLKKMMERREVRNEKEIKQEAEVVGEVKMVGLWVFVVCDVS